jgi:hypothetical protein
MYAAYANDGHISAVTDAMLGGTELVSLSLVWLALAAPAFYGRWIEGRAAVESQAE